MNLPKTPGPRIMVVEDEKTMRIALQDCLEAEGYRVLTAADGELALPKILDEKPDLIVLDVMMPGLDGFAVARSLRNSGSETAILMLTAKGQISDRVRGLDAGADDYLTKPFSSEELLARIRALLRRNKRSSNHLRSLRLGDVDIDLVRKEARRGPDQIHLTAREFAMLQLLADHPNEPVSREKFLDVVWGYTAFPTTRTVDNHMASIRSKIETDPANPIWFETIHGIGYRLNLQKHDNPASPLAP